MMPVVQVDRHFISTKRVGYCRQAIPETHDGRVTIYIQDRWRWITAIESPDVGWQEVRMERVRAGPGFHFIGHMGRGELSPALMWRSVGFTGSQVRMLLREWK